MNGPEIKAALGMVSLCRQRSVRIHRLTRTADSTFLSHNLHVQSRFMPALTPTDRCYLGELTLDQSTVVRIHVPEPLPLQVAL
jgi:hypothetical protein